MSDLQDLLEEVVAPATMYPKGSPPSPAGWPAVIEKEKGRNSVKGVKVWLRSRDGSEAPCKLAIVGQWLAE